VALERASLADLYAQYPSLIESSHLITSGPTDKYNCAAWVERDLTHWYEPGLYWPDGLPQPDGLDDLHCYVALFELWDYEGCAEPDYEPGFLKIAIYAIGSRFCHVAKQIRGSDWSSKGGGLHDFRHGTLDALYPSGIMENARPTMFMRRPDDGTDPQHLERAGLIPA
jgi:hypothetical protein